MTDKIVERLLGEVIDATFTKRGFNARTHREAILAALGDAGYAIVPKPADSLTQLWKEAEVEGLRDDLALARAQRSCGVVGSETPSP